ncbi:hypothetical protein HAQ01_03995 [Acidithiobacillus thiooxidans]|uniref:hypothetical protein n=1 Tax=Acidithiobacillus thiooxidans TaxID=930 RepID=UPI001C0758CA|nr:hypothetical protein [Acidithiobacillus thiooxidans]MBU2792587.1 hypothetical protein [Acidithiobacillus thiooxidans]
MSGCLKVISVSMDRPDVFFGMNAEEMAQVRCWLEHYTRQNTALRIEDGRDDFSADNLQHRKAMYVRGVELGLNAIGLGHSMLPGASVLSKPWTDAMGTEWQWDATNLQPISNRLEANLDERDFSELPDEEFAVFVRGLLDSVGACGWIAEQRPSAA